ncbi:hypothetical protein HMPREF9372_1582 [Sporosarcina newyorkensis 2681]|uniref:Uncharacterized protein n=1 Tax=Sporosarcina newyorkensis 2681 TaxID=1027292 RepID=F9DS02_9BACL|nr:hypothetical protein HMPREF9372_1582 [Sporosarcina newyorkensis 2681]
MEIIQPKRVIRNFIFYNLIKGFIAENTSSNQRVDEEPFFKSCWEGFIVRQAVKRD